MYSTVELLIKVACYVQKSIMFATSKAASKNKEAGNTEGGSITVPLTSCLTGLESAV